MYQVVAFILVAIYILNYFFKKNHDYWKKRNVPFIKPSLFFGNYKDSILLKRHLTEVTTEICQQFPDEPYFGTFYGTEPVLVVQDPELIKLMFAKDFYYFSGREVTDHAHKETVTKSLFFIGGDEWKVLRQNLTPLFTSAKIKGMFPLVTNCIKNLENLMEKEVKTSVCHDARVLLARYTIDCITTCAFGFDANTLKDDVDENNPFMIMRQKIFEESSIRGIKTNFRAIWPALFYTLKLSQFDESISNFFNNLVTAVFTERKSGKSFRNDFIDLILTWRQNAYISGDSMSNSITGDKKTIRLEVNEELLVSQCVLFYAAGFETTATTSSLLLYEISKNKDAQAKLIEEVDEYLEKTKGKIEFECITETPYLNSCVTETLRLYPVLGVLTREVMDDYTLPTGLRLEKGDRIHIPVKNIHSNPKYYPEPEKFIPERFLGDEIKNITPYTILSFGEGSRLCIGARFAKMVICAGIISILKDYRLELAEDTPMKLQFSPVSLPVSPSSKLNLKFIPRKV